MPKLLDKLNLDHKHLSRLLDLMEKQLDGFHEGNEPDFELMCEMLEYVENYADQVHHPTEDLIFHRLLERSDKRRDVMETLFEQHQTLSRVASFRWRANCSRTTTGNGSKRRRRLPSIRFSASRIRPASAPCTNTSWEPGTSRNLTGKGNLAEIECFCVRRTNPFQGVAAVVKTKQARVEARVRLAQARARP